MSQEEMVGEEKHSSSKTKKSAGKRDRLPMSKFIWSGIKRRTFRNVVTVMTFAVVAAILLSAFFLIGGAENSMQVGMDRLGADLMVVPQQYEHLTDSLLLAGHPSTFFFNSSELSGIEQVPGVAQTAPQTYIATLNAGCCAFPTQLVAFDSSRDFTIQPWIRQALGRQLLPDEIILGSSFIGSGEGYHLIFYGHDFTVAGVLEKTGTGIDQSIFIQYPDALAMANDSKKLAVQELTLKPGQISSILVKLAPGYDGEQVAANITSTVVGSSVITSNHLARKISDQVSGTLSTLYLTAASVAIVSIPLIATISTMVANERRRELGLLRSMGANKLYIFLIVVAEAILLASIGALIGGVVATASLMIFQNLITTSLEIPFLWPPLTDLAIQTTLVVGLAIGFGGLTSLYPAVKSVRTEPYDSIRLR
ncbi:MAG: FtsX-like permease family protein [Methanomassiliicoccales archaeon PtaU1.Bin124]|nr:MAG: FtsX-like permease family protein [Methanomassiliicoccales archaeon PtaU1.Bin124]